MKLCTSIEQSQKLMELGIDINTADMYWLNRHVDLTGTKYEIFVVDKSNKHIDFFNSYAVAVEKCEIIPGWSLTALLDLIPDIIEDYVLRIDKVDGEYFIWYDKIGEGWSDAIAHPSSENFIDAAFEIIVWLKENGKI